MSVIPEDVLEWLVDENDPSIRYRVLTELLSRGPRDADVVRTRARVPGSPAVERLFSAMQPDGSWHIGKRSSLLVVGTALNYLAELGLDAGDERVDRAVAHLFLQQAEDGDFHRHYSCLNGLILRALNRLGYRADSRTQKLKALLLSSVRHDGGFHCDMRPKGRRTADHKSCIMGSLKALLAFAEMPDVWQGGACRALVSYFLKRHVCFRTGDMNALVVPDIAKAVFPFSYKVGLLEPLYALSRLGHGQRPEMKKAWALLDQHRTDTGRYILRAGTTLPVLSAGPKGKPSKWATFYAYLCLRQRDKLAKTP